MVDADLGKYIADGGIAHFFVEAFRGTSRSHLDFFDAHLLKLRFCMLDKFRTETLALSALINNHLPPTYSWLSAGAPALSSLRSADPALTTTLLHLFLVVCKYESLPVDSLQKTLWTAAMLDVRLTFGIRGPQKKTPLRSNIASQA
jgi:hypothetical protein